MQSQVCIKEKETKRRIQRQVCIKEKETKRRMQSQVCIKEKVTKDKTKSGLCQGFFQMRGCIKKNSISGEENKKLKTRFVCF